MPLIQMENIRRTYQAGSSAVEALRGISLTVEAGEFLAIIGSSGSGKSTLMNLLGCLDLPDSGRYLLDGADISNLDEETLTHIRNRKIGFIFQGFHLIPTLSALENVELPLFYRGVGPKERRQMAISALEKMGLASRMEHRPNELSGGQQQRAAIARAIAASPPLILADEPTGNLDSATGKEVMQCLISLNREGKTIVLITHDPTVAAMAHRTVQIQDGRLTNPAQTPSISGAGTSPPPLQ